MAQILNSYDEWLGAMQQPAGAPTLDNTTLYKGYGEPSASLAPPTQQQAPTPQLAPPTLAPPTQQQQPTQKPQQGGDLWGGIQKQLEAQQQALGQAQQTFQQQAGPSRTYESVGAEGTLSGAVETGLGEQEARALLGAGYGGPAGLSADQLNYDLQQLGLQGRALQTGTGVMDLLAQTTGAGLGSGALRFEAKRLLEDPAFAAQRAATREQIKAFGGELGQAETGAKAFAEQRAGEESDIAKRSREYLRGRETGIESQWQEAIKQAEAEEAKRTEQWRRFQETGDIFGLQGLESPEDRARTEAWQTSRQDVMAKYSDRLGEIPEMVLNDRDGTEYTFDDEWWKANKSRYNKKEWADIKEAARQRQRELEALGERPGTASSVAADAQRRQDAEAKWGEIMGDPRFAAISELAPLTPKVSRHGRTVYAIPDPKTGRPTRIEKAKWLSDEQRQALLDRQAALEQYFGEQISPQKRGSAAKGYRGTMEPWQEGEYRELKPLYYGEGARPLPEYEYRTGFDYTPAGTASRETLTTEEQATQFNRINDLLGEADRVQQADPYKAGELRADVDQFLAEEERALASRETELDAARKKYLNKVRKTREAVRDSNNYWGAVLAGTFGMPTAPWVWSGDLSLREGAAKSVYPF